jgi:N-methylhydantoinase B
VKPDDVLIMIAASGGGYGDPLERDPAAVLADVRQGLVSPDAASEVYGVVIAADAVDAEATVVLRSQLLEERQEGAVAAPGSQHPIPNRAGRSEGAHPLRENLEVVTVNGAAWVQCTACGHRLGTLDDDWTAAAAHRRLEPTRAGPLMAPLVGTYLLEQLCCPVCGVLLNTDVIEKGDSAP